MGTSSYYNNYSLGGARIVLKTNIVAEIVKDVSVASDKDNIDNIHKVYHKPFCKTLALNQKASSGTPSINELSNGGLVTGIEGEPNMGIPTSYDGLLRASNQELNEPDRVLHNDSGHYSENRKADNLGVFDSIIRYKVSYISNLDSNQAATKLTSGVVEEFLNAEDAENHGFHACTECY